MVRYEFTPARVCSTKISFALEGDIVHDVDFTGGCNGNLKAISKLIEGQKLDYVVDMLKGNTCGMKGTSCADQLAIALTQAQEQK